MSEVPTVSLSPSSSSSTIVPSSDSSLSSHVSSLRINESPVPSDEGVSSSGIGLSPGSGGGGITQGEESIPPMQLLSSSPPKHEDTVVQVQAKMKAILPVLSSCTYTPCYCEENIWLLCDKIRTEYSSELAHCQVAFISNAKRMVPLWRQKSGKREEKLAVWDYHVILLYNPDDRCVVYDMDSDLPFPTHFHKYVTETFRTENILQPEFHRFFRILNAPDFLHLFSSDRSHMLKADGSYGHPPPPYPPICTNGVNNVEEFLDMTIVEKTNYGEVLPLMDLVRRFYKPKRPS